MTSNVHKCATCTRNKDQKKPCHVWKRLGQPEKVLNCLKYRDARETA